MTTATALHIAESIVVDGFDSFDADLAQLLDEARRSNVNPVFVDVAGDRSAPAPVRERALGHVVVELSRDLPMPALPTWVTRRVRRNVAGPIAA
ncbi:MAG: hypothetical protein ABJH68_00225 [Ilumatobacter sp.]|uniref:hypothetical protein n=1 Tax=Ilumatobacter sp. TaxID=1967498 RepID=UPI00329724B1